MTPEKMDSMFKSWAAGAGPTTGTMDHIYKLMRRAFFSGGAVAYRDAAGMARLALENDVEVRPEGWELTAKAIERESS